MQALQFERLFALFTLKPAGWSGKFVEQGWSGEIDHEEAFPVYLENNNNMALKVNKVSVVIERDEHGYYAFCPGLQGCQSQGDTFEEVMANIKEAAELYISTLSPEEKAELLSKEILTTSLQVELA